MCEDLLSSVDQPLKIARDKTHGKDFLLCDYNRDGDSYRCAFLTVHYLYCVVFFAVFIWWSVLLYYVLWESQHYQMLINLCFCCIILHKLHIGGVMLNVYFKQTSALDVSLILQSANKCCWCSFCWTICLLLQVSMEQPVFSSSWWWSHAVRQITSVGNWCECCFWYLPWYVGAVMPLFDIHYSLLVYYCGHQMLSFLGNITILIYLYAIFVE